MQDPDEVIQRGVNEIQGATPRRCPEELLMHSHRAISVGKTKRGVIWTVGTGVLASSLVLVFTPKPAMAMLLDAMKRSDNVKIFHRHMTLIDSPDRKHFPRMELYATRHDSDVWVLSDRMEVQSKDRLDITYRNGKEYNYDTLFPFGVADQNAGPFMPYRVQVEDLLKPKTARLVSRSTVQAHGGTFEEYVVRDAGDGWHSPASWHVYVDPQTQLVRYVDSGVQDSHVQFAASDEYDYPDESTIEREAPSYPPDLSFVSEKDLADRFLASIHKSDQSKVVGGIRTTLYGVVFIERADYGAAVVAITRGGAGQMLNEKDALQLVGVKTNPLLRAGYEANRRPLTPSEDGPTIATETEIDGESYWVNTSASYIDQKIPRRITVRVPVWKEDPSKSYKTFQGAFHPSKCVGYATFTTSKLYYTCGFGIKNLPSDFYTSPMSRGFTRAAGR